MKGKYIFCQSVISLSAQTSCLKLSLHTVSKPLMVKARLEVVSDLVGWFGRPPVSLAAPMLV